MNIYAYKWYADFLREFVFCEVGQLAHMVFGIKMMFFSSKNRLKFDIAERARLFRMKLNFSEKLTRFSVFKTKNARKISSTKNKI